MDTKKILSLSIILLFLSPILGYADRHYRSVLSQKSDIYYGHISFVEDQSEKSGPFVLREGNPFPETALLNFPLAPGDTIRTTDTGRCEIQFDTGTIVRLDLNTELKIETILAQTLTARKKVTNLVLKRGEIYVMYKRYYRRELFQIKTPNAAVKMNHRSVAVINIGEENSTSVQVQEGKTYVLYGFDMEHVHKEKLKKQQQLTISKKNELLKGKAKKDVDFELWNENINKNFMELHEGKTFIPQPIQKLPEAVFNFAQKYSNRYGEWIWNGFLGYVWRPFANNYYPSGNWRPYFYGQWRNIEGQLFWVPQESWGWVPYHLGLWIWDTKLGWVWIPGSAFAPAWVDWHFFFGYYGWRAWSPWDWYYDNLLYAGGGYGYLGGGGPSQGEGKKPITVIRKDQLKKKGIPDLPIPKSLIKICSKVGKALKNNDDRILSSIRMMPEHVVLVKRKNLRAAKIQKVAVKFKNIPSRVPGDPVYQKPHKDPYRAAVMTFQRNNILAYIQGDLSFNKPERTKKTDILFKSNSAPKTETMNSERWFFRPEAGNSKKERSFSKKAEIRQPVSSAKMCFRDWNPDIKAVCEAGISIMYLSLRNEVLCPELNISSGDYNSFRRGKYSSGGSGFSRGSTGSSGSTVSGNSSGSSSKVTGISSGTKGGTKR